jgi:CheY-like chemotaxis protein
MPSILIVDDHPMLRDLFARVLTAGGHQVTVAGTAAMALAAAARDPFDLMILDVEMPESDGIALATAVRGGTGPNRATPILLVSGHDPDTIRDRAPDPAPFEGVLQKPVDAVGLLRAVARMVAAG